MEQILISKENLSLIIKGFANDLYNKINNKDLSTLYIEQFSKAGILKTDGSGDMFLCNNGEYVKIDLNSIKDINDKIETIYDLFKITEDEETSWSTGKPMSIPRNGASSCVYEDNIYVLGGFNEENSPIDKVEIYNTKTDTWKYGTDIISSSGNMSTVINNNKIYCMGGQYSNLNRIYDIKTNTWSYGLDLGINTYNFTSETYNNKIYCIGGIMQSGGITNYSNDIKIYDIESNVWTYGLNMPAPRGNYNLTSCIYNDKIYAIGGWINYTLIYDIKSNTWNSIKNMPTPRQKLKCEIYNGKIYCIGGISSTALDIVEVYDIKNDSWKTSISMLSPKYAFTSEIINNKIYCIGGYTNISFNTMDILSLPHMIYDIKLPEELDNKLNIIKSDGLGNKLLADNGTYIDPSNNYTSMSIEEINSLIDEVKTANGGV